MIKFNRYWHLKYYTPIVKDDGSIDMKNAKLIELEYPLKLDFNISRNTFSSSNRATLNIYNLGQGTRDAIFQDYLNMERYCFVELYAGYGETYENLPLVLKGKVLSAYSEDHGTEVVTRIEVIDNSIIESLSSHTFDAGTPIQEVYDTIAQDMQLVELGSTGTHEGVLDRPFTVNGNSLEELNNLTGGHAFIDNNRLNILYDNEVLGDYGIYKLTSDSGLLGMPKRRDAQIEIDCLFAPEIAVGQLVEVDSQKDPLHFNGQYKVVGISHNGVISGAESGNVKTTLNLYAGVELPNSNWVYTQKIDEPLTSVTGSDKSTVTINVTKYNIRDVYNYIQKNNKPPSTKLTKNISWMEALNYNEMQAKGTWAKPPIEHISNLAATADKLQKFVDKYYPGKSIIIDGAYRTPQHQDYVRKRYKNAAKDSQHVRGKAFDFHLPNVPLRTLFDTVVKYGGFGFTYKSDVYNFVHVDIRNAKGIAREH